VECVVYKHSYKHLLFMVSGVDAVSVKNSETMSLKKGDVQSDMGWVHKIILKYHSQYHDYLCTSTAFAQGTLSQRLNTYTGFWVWVGHSIESKCLYYIYVLQCKQIKHTICVFLNKKIEILVDLSTGTHNSIWLEEVENW